MIDQFDVSNAVDMLNELFKADPKAMNSLVAYRVECNEELAKHPTCQVGSYCDVHTKEACPDMKVFKVGILGVINALFGKDDNGNGFIAGTFEEGTLTGFCVFKL